MLPSASIVSLLAAINLEGRLLLASPLGLELLLQTLYRKPRTAIACITEFRTP